MDNAHDTQQRSAHARQHARAGDGGNDMSENEMSLQERDAETIAEYRGILAEYEAATDAHERYITSEAIKVYAEGAAESAIRTIDALTAERDDLRAEIARLRAAMAAIAFKHSESADNVTKYHPPYHPPELGIVARALANVHRKAAASIRAALESDSTP